MDIRAAIAGAIAIIALLGLIVLAAIGEGADALDRLDAIITGALGLLFGLYSSPYTAPDDETLPNFVDEPASIRLREEGGVDALGIVSLAVAIAWAFVVLQVAVWIVR